MLASFADVYMCDLVSMSLMIHSVKMRKKHTFMLVEKVFDVLEQQNTYKDYNNKRCNFISDAVEFLFLAQSSILPISLTGRSIALSWDINIDDI